MDFGEILSKSWKTIWNHKTLWVFGILAALGQSGSGGSGGRINNSYSGDLNFWGNGRSFDLNPNDFSSLAPGLQRILEQISAFISNIPWWLMTLIVIGVILLGILCYAASIIGKTGLILGAEKADQGIQKLTFGELLSESLKYFWKVVGFTLLAGVIILAVLLVLLLPVALLSAGTFGIALIPFLCILAPVMIVVNLVLEQGIRAIVLDNSGVLNAYAYGWNVVKSNFGNVVLMAIILAVIQAVVGFIIMLPLLSTLIPVLMPLLSNAGTMPDLSTLQAPATISLLLGCLVSPIYLLLRGMLEGYTQTAWTLTYLRLTQPVAHETYYPGE